jgi:hypothetical protein
MIVRTKDCRALGTNGAVAERGALSANRDDSYVSGTVHVFLSAARISSPGAGFIGHPVEPIAISLF